MLFRSASTNWNLCARFIRNYIYESTQDHCRCGVCGLIWPCSLYIVFSEKKLSFQTSTMRPSTFFPASFLLLLVIVILLPFTSPASLLRDENQLTTNRQSLPVKLMSSNLPSSTDSVERLASAKVQAGRNWSEDEAGRDAVRPRRTWNQLPVDQLRRVKKTGGEPARRR